MNIFICILLVSFSCTFAQDSTSDVVVLTTKNFNDVSKGTWLVEFYAPWCGHCKNLAPTWEKLATELKGSVNIGKVDCTVETPICAGFSIGGYPTIKAIKDGKVYDYSSGRSLESFNAYLQSDYSASIGKNLPTFAAPAQDSPSSPDAASSSDVVVLTDSNFDQLTAKGDWLLEFYAPWCGHCKHLAPVYEKLATEVKGKTNVGKIDCTTETRLGSRFGIRGYPTIKYLKDGKVREYNSERTLDGFTDYLNKGYQSITPSDLPHKDAGDSFDFDAQLKAIEVFAKERVFTLLPIFFILGLLTGKIIFGGGIEKNFDVEEIPAEVDRKDD